MREQRSDQQVKELSHICECCLWMVQRVGWFGVCCSRGQLTATEEIHFMSFRVRKSKTPSPPPSTHPFWNTPLCLTNDVTSKIWTKFVLQVGTGPGLEEVTTPGQYIVYVKPILPGSSCKNLHIRYNVQMLTGTMSLQHLLWNNQFEMTNHRDSWSDWPTVQEQIWFKKKKAHNRSET